ncbi:MAG: HlyD family type I secretion periplasmic adaptor subunit, partial [Rhodospirillales bacterium]
GQPASVRVLAPEFARYGGITGELKEISDAALKDERGRSYHRAVIALERASVGRGRGLVRLMPGMPIQARIKTGSRTLFAHVWHSAFGG